MSDLGRVWEWFADTSCKGYSPIYDRICRFVANDDELLALIRESPPPAHQPNVILGVVHYLLLGGLDHALAAVYAGESDADPGPLFHDVCLTHRAAVLELMETRRTQTNECGRSATRSVIPRPSGRATWSTTSRPRSPNYPATRSRA